MWYVLLHDEESSVLVGADDEYKVHSIDAGTVSLGADDVNKERRKPQALNPQQGEAMDMIRDAEDDDDRVLQQKQIQFGDVLQMMLLIARGKAVDDEMLYSRNRRREQQQQQEQVNNESKKSQLMLMIVAARIELLPLQIPYPQRSDDDGFCLHSILKCECVVL